MNLPWRKTNSTFSPALGRFDSPIQQFFDEFWNDINSPVLSGQRALFVPKINVVETDQNYTITAELPGLEEKDFEVNLENNVLRIRGEKKTTSEHKDTKFSRYEASYGSFERAFELPTDVEPEKVQAKFKNGVLDITLEKSQNSTRSKKIQIESH